MAHIYAKLFCTLDGCKHISFLFGGLSFQKNQVASDRLQLLEILEIASFFTTFSQVFLSHTRHAGGVCLCVVLTCCSHTLSSFYKGDLIL